MTPNKAIELTALRAAAHSQRFAGMAPRTQHKWRNGMTMPLIVVVSLALASPAVVSRQARPLRN